MHKPNKRLSLIIGIITLLSILGIVITNTKSRIFLINLFNTTTQQAQAQVSNTDWYTVAANPQRTSYVSTEVRNTLKPEWFYRIPFYISQKVQPIITNNTIYISSSKGLYALTIGAVGFNASTREANTQTLKWIYCTSSSTGQPITSGDCGPDELPLGNSPTVINNIAYVGGFDKKVHAVNATTGVRDWVFNQNLDQGVEGGFHANPLVVGDKLFIGNRDGYLYAIYISGGNKGQLAWKFKTDGPILQSAAASKDGSVIFFASNDMHAYAVNAANGSQNWKSPKLPGSGFHSYWPVVTTQKNYETNQDQDFVIFSGIQSWGNVNDDESEQIFGTPRTARVGGQLLDGSFDLTNQVAGPWPTGTYTLDASTISNYYKNKPWRRELFIFDTTSGVELTFANGLYAPLSHIGPDQGTAYPPVIGKNGTQELLLRRTSYEEGGIPRGGIVAWKFGTPILGMYTREQTSPSQPTPTPTLPPSIVPNNSLAVDEPASYALGGNVIYEKLMGERHSKASDYMVTHKGTSWNYHTQGGTSFLSNQLPALFETGWPYSYFKHGDISPMVPYGTKVYSIANNAVVAFATAGASGNSVDSGYDTGVNGTTAEMNHKIAGIYTNVTASDGNVQQIKKNDISSPLVFTDITNSSAFTFFDTVAKDDMVYFGSNSNEFRSLVFHLSQLPQNINLQWQYWNSGGTTPGWSALTVNDDGGPGLFSATGLTRVFWTKPTTWGQTTVDGVSAYWIRLRVQSLVNGATVYTSPATTGQKVSSIVWPTLLQQESYFSINGNLRPNYYPYFSVSATTNETGVPTSKTTTPGSQTSELTANYGTGFVKTRLSQRTPAVLFENTASNTYVLQGRFKGFAYQAGGTQKIVDAGSVAGSSLSEGWLLVWDETEHHRWFPFVLSLQNQPTSITLSSTGLTIQYPAAAGYLSFIPLNGISDPLPGNQFQIDHGYYSSDRTLGANFTWATNSIPASAITRARNLAKISQSFPISWTDSYSINSSNNNVTLTANYPSFISFNNFKSNPITQNISLIPPHAALAGISLPTISQEFPADYLLPWGKLAGLTNATSVQITYNNLAQYWRGILPPATPPSSGDPMQAKLDQEAQKMTQAGHLRPGYIQHGQVETIANGQGAEWLFEYFHSPSDTITTLIQALPFVSPAIQSNLRTYIASEYANYSPETNVHTGYNNGETREVSGKIYIDPVTGSKSDFEASLNNFKPVADKRTTAHGPERSWDFSPMNFYAVFLYAKEFQNDPVNPANPATIFTAMKGNLDHPSQFGYFKGATPYILNSYIGGYMGYLKLANLAGQLSTVKAQEDQLIDFLLMRAALSKYPNALTQVNNEHEGYLWAVYMHRPDTGDITFHRDKIGTLWSQYDTYGFKNDSYYLYTGWHVGGGYSFSIDFVNLVPELGKFMRDTVPTELQDQVSAHNLSAPYWFVTKAEEAAGEQTIQPLQDTIALFSAKAYGLQESRQELEKYLDVPAFERGDLYYIQKLTGILSSTSDGSPIPTVTSTPPVSPCTPLGDANCSGKVNILDLSLLLSNFSSTLSQYDLNSDNTVNLQDISILISNFGK